MSNAVDQGILALEDMRNAIGEGISSEMKATVESLTPHRMLVQLSSGTFIVSIEQVSGDGAAFARTGLNEQWP